MRLFKKAPRSLAQARAQPNPLGRLSSLLFRVLRGLFFQSDKADPSSVSVRGMGCTVTFASASGVGVAPEGISLPGVSA